MAAGKHDIYIEQGATFTLQVTWKDSAGAAYNLTGCTARMQIRQKVGSPLILGVTTTSGEIVLGGVTGVITVELTAAQTDKLEVASAVYDLEVAFPSGKVYRVLQGKATIDPNVTRDIP